MKYEMSLREVVVDGVGGFYVFDVIDASTGEVLRSSETYDALNIALDEFAVAQLKWFNELKVDPRFDEWHLSVDVTL